MLDREQFDKIVEELAAEIPAELYEKLNGGVIVLDRAKLHPESRSDRPDKLYILGEYIRSHDMGRYIAIYYGSYNALYPDRDVESLRDDLRKTMRHEFRHHIENLAGDRSLEIEDMERLNNYRENKRWETPGERFRIKRIDKF